MTGTGFRPITAVTVGGTKVSAFFANDAFFFTTPANIAGPADIAVWDRDVQVASLAGGFVYAAPEVFDFNGEWEGGYGPDWQTPIRFTVRNNILISITCDSSDVALTPAPSISDGAFSVSGPNGVIVTGRITSPGHAKGTLDRAPCDSFLPKDYWEAAKVP